MHRANRRTTLATVLLASLSSVVVGTVPARAQAGNQPSPLLSDIVDVSRDYHDFTNAFYVADRLGEFDPATASGQLTWVRHQLVPLFAFDNVIVTPHSAFYSEGSLAELLTKASTRVAEALTHQTPACIMNPEVLKQANLRLKVKK